MDAVDVFLLYVVGFSVILFLIVDSYEQRRKNCHKADQSSVDNDSECLLESVKASDDDREEESYEKQLVSEDSKGEVFQEIEEAAEILVNANSERSGFCNGLLDVSENTKIDICCNNMGVSECDGKGEEESFDDWEGIERTELEKSFGEAVVFVNGKSNGDEIDGDVKLELYGLQKIALEGPCHGSQPMVLNVSARAKWNAWQKVGNMSREMAMEKYIDILARAIPEWKGDGVEAAKDARSSED